MNITVEMVEEMQEAVNGVVRDVLRSQIDKLEGRGVSSDDIKKFCVTNSEDNFGALPAASYYWRNRKIISLLDPSVRDDGRVIISIVKHLEECKIKVVDFQFSQAANIIH